MRNLALSDITADDLRVMLEEGETLFVEHKTALRGEGFQVAKAICSFANTLGGWVLLGVTDAQPNAGAANGWKAVAPHELTDRVREALRDNRVDPIPAFAATVKTYGSDDLPIGVIRVYESADSPHVMGNGQVLVRSVAQDTNAARVYRPGGIETQSVLLALVERGRHGIAEAEQKVNGPWPPFFAPCSVGMKRSMSDLLVEGPRLIVRAAPVTSATLADWAVSQAGKDALFDVLRRLAGVGQDVSPELRTDATGLAATQRTTGGSPETPTPEWGTVAAAVDAAGVIAVSRTFGVSEPRGPVLEWTLNELRDRVVGPVLTATAALLQASESCGRSVMRLDVGYISHAVTLLSDGPARSVPSMQLSGQLTLPAGAGEIAALAARWIDDLGRSAGFETLRT